MKKNSSPKSGSHANSSLRLKRPPRFNTIVMAVVVVLLVVIGYIIISSYAAPTAPTPASKPYIRLFSELNNASEAKNANNATKVAELKNYYVHIHGEASNPNAFSLGSATKTSSTDTTFAKKLSQAGIWSSQYRNGSYISQANSSDPLFGEANDIEHNAPLAINTVWPGNYVNNNTGDNNAAGGRLVSAVGATTTSLTVSASTTAKSATWPYIPSQDANGDGYSNSTADYISWIRVGNEIMRITGVPTASGTNVIIPVARGYFGTAAASHSAQDRVFVPLYIGSTGAVASDQGLSGTPSINSSSKALRYGIKIWQPDGYNWIANRIKSVFGADLQGYNTIHLDVSSCAQYNNAFYDGTQVFGWDDANSQKLSRTRWGEAQKQKVTGLRAALPGVIFTANSLYGADKARNDACTDGLLQHDDGGVFEHWLKNTNGYSYDYAQSMDQSFKVMANNWPGIYWIRWNYDFSGDVNKYKRFTYGSLLLSYRASANRYQYGGLWGAGKPDAIYFYDLGAPKTNPANLAETAVTGQTNLYKREFANGFVVVNSDNTASKTYDLGGSYYKIDVAGNPTLVTSVTLASQDAAILLKPVGTSPTPTPTPAPDTQAPSAPTNLQVISKSTNSVSLSWTASTDNVAAAGYKVYRNSNEVANTASTTLTDSNLTANTAYTYSVKAYDAAGNVSASSAQITASTDPLPNALPTVSITSPVANTIFTEPATINISSNASDPDGQVNLVEYFDGATKLGEDAASPYSYTWNNVPVGGHNIWAKATDNKGATANSQTINVNVVEAVQTDSVSPTAPQGLVRTFSWDWLRGAYYVDLQWKASTDNIGVKNYQIFRNNTFIAGPTETNYQDDGISQRKTQTYTYQVRAKDAAGNVSNAASTSIKVTCNWFYCSAK